MIIAVALVPVVFDLPPQRPEWLALAVALGAAAILIVVIELIDGRQRVGRLVPVAFYLLAIASLRHSAGGAESGYSALALLATLMLAYLGTRRDLILGTALMTLTLAAPILIFGPPDYPIEEWRRVLFTTMVGAFIGFALRRVLATLVVETEHTRDQREALARQVEITTAILDTATDAIVSFDADGRATAANAAAEVLLGRTEEALVGHATLLDLVAPDDRERIRSGLARWRVASPLPDRDRRFETDVVWPDGTRVPTEVTIATTNGPDGPRFHAFSRDISERRAVERADRDHLDDLDRLLSVAEDLGRTSVDGRSAVCAAARDFAAADFALLYTLDSSRGRLVVTGSAGADPPTDIELDPDRSVAGDVLRSGEPAFIGDLDADPRIDKSITVRVGAAAAFLHPIAVDDRPVGVLVAYWRAPVAALPERVQTMFRLFATQAAIAVERADLLARLEALARTDALTGAANRRTLDDVLAVAMADARRSTRPVSIAMLDLDHFKAYNDRHGHQGGDDLLRAAVHAWNEHLRPTDTLARYGGEEFLVVLPSTESTGSVVVADRLLQAVPGDASASAGVATWNGTETATAFIARADAALYEAKAGGRARTVASVSADPG